MLLWYLNIWQRIPQSLSSSKGEKLNQDKQTQFFQLIFVALFLLLVFLNFFIEALKEIKHQFFSGNDNTGYEPAFGTVSVTDGTAFSIGHLFAASVCNGGPAPNIFPSWILRYITGGANNLMEKLPVELSGSRFEFLYKQVRVWGICTIRMFYIMSYETELNLMATERRKVVASLHPAEKNRNHLYIYYVLEKQFDILHSTTTMFWLV